MKLTFKLSAGRVIPERLEKKQMPKLYKHNCKLCSQPLGKPEHKSQQFCCDEHRNEWKAQRRATWSSPRLGTRYVLDCVVCTAKFTASRQDRKTCSRECRAKWLALKQMGIRRKHRNVCKLCGCEFVGDPDRTICSSECRVAHRQRRIDIKREEMLSRLPSCENCGERHRGSGRICLACCDTQREVNRTHCIRCSRLHDDPPRLSPKLCDECKPVVSKQQRQKDRYNRKQRKRLLKDSGGYEPIVRRTVFDRDKWKCQHCKCRCVHHSRERGNNQATIDHIMPLARGGTHTYANAQLLCRRCNEKKQATLTRPEQLRFIG
jgi:hypothetical protein